MMYKSDKSLGVEYKTLGKIYDNVKVVLRPAGKVVTVQRNKENIWRL